MRKIAKGFLIGCLTAVAIPTVLILTLVGGCVVEACLPRNAVKLAAAMLQTELPAGTKAVIKKDTGPGLPIPGGASDGYSWIVLQVPADQIAHFSQTLAGASRWKRLPLPPELAAGENLLQPTSMNEGRGHIPLETAKGYYQFTDEQAEQNRKYPGRIGYDTAKPFYDRPSLDFIFGVFDETTGLLYVWRLNT
jgi:hypothetical protein